MSGVIPFPAGRRGSRTLPLGTDLPPAILRLKEIAAQSSDAMLTEGPVHPDHVLLDLCGDALHLVRAAQALDERWRALRSRGPDRAERDRLFEQAGTLSRQASGFMRRAKKIKATTAAGVFAKALLVRASRTGAAELAMTLAEDLINCPGLRASLWPAEPQP